MNISGIEKFRTKLENDMALGPFSKTEDPAMIEVIGYSGFDFVILDMEHGPNSIRSLQNLVRAAECVGLASIVRVPEDFPQAISAALDIGACGVQVPQVSTKEAAVEAVRSAKFSPAGGRGVCRFVRAADYSSMDKTEYFKQANNAVLIAQIEGREGLDNLDDIISVKGIDVIFLGPYDLSQSLGVPGEVKHPLVIEAVKDVNEKCRRRGIHTGTFVEDKESSIFWHGLGMNYICYSVDEGLMYEACKSVVEDIARARS